MPRSTRQPRTPRQQASDRAVAVIADAIGASEDEVVRRNLHEPAMRGVVSGVTAAMELGNSVDRDSIRRALEPPAATRDAALAQALADGLRAVPARRGCGTRHARGVYAEGVPDGPLTACLFDPPLTLAEVGEPGWFEPHRQPLMFERDGVTHFVVWVGAEYYPHVWDFIEEVRAAGASRKLPPHFDFSRVTEASRMFFVHPRARVMLESPSGSVAGGALESALVDAAPTEGPDEGEGRPLRRLPCGHAYEVSPPPQGVAVRAEPAVFMQLPITGVALVNDRGAFPEAVEARVRRARVPVFRSDH